MKIKNGKSEISAEGGACALELPGFSIKANFGRLLSDGVERAMNWRLEKSDAKSLKFKCENELGKWSCELLLDSTGAEIRFKGRLNRPQASSSLNLVALQIPELECSHVLAQGRLMGGCNSVSLPVEKARRLEGRYQLMVSRGRRLLQLSYPLRQAQPALFAMELSGSCARGLEALAQVENFGGLDVEAPALRLATVEDGFAAMERWADENSELKKDFSHTVAPGWNSWDYYRWTITEEEVLKNAEFIAKDPVLSKHVKRIIVDDGWQYCYGEWEANSLFPSGMEKLAKELSKMGFEPGLWFAPTIVEPHCRIAQLDYDMLAMGESGQPCLAFECMRRYGFVLDPTQEKVRKLLGKLFSRYVGMGYKYFKLDFMGETLKARRFADPTVPRSQIARLVVEPIWNAVKGKAQILGCNYCFEGGNKFVDSVRVGSDIHSTWGGLTHNAVSVAARFWANKRLWVNDPDFALCRGFDTTDDPDLTRLLPCLVFNTPEKAVVEPGWLKPMVDLRKPQLEILLGVVLMAGGAVNLSDKMPLLNESGLDLARRAVSAESGEAARPLDLFESERPSYWLQRLKKGHRALLVNWTDAPAKRSLDLRANGVKAKTAVDFWSGKKLSLDNGVLEANLAPRSCLLATLL